VAYDQLSDESKAYDRDTSIEALKVIQALGYIMQPTHHHSTGNSTTSSSTSSTIPGSRTANTLMSATSSSMMDFDVEFGLAVADGDTYAPQPIATDDISLSPELNSLVELLAENTHDVWAKKRMEEGWVYGPQRNDPRKEHDGLVPYVYLTSDEKDMDRNTAVQTIKCILRCGLFGRSEDAQMARLEDATAAAMTVQKAKDAFMGRRGHKTYGSVTFADSPTHHHPSATPSVARASSVELPPTTSGSMPLTSTRLRTSLRRTPSLPSSGSPGVSFLTTDADATTPSHDNDQNDDDVQIHIQR
ncbi:hypothetical protein DYB31_009193, partial [Aphanomyces astaci]